MSEQLLTTASQGAPPDPDLLEYVMVCASGVDGLGPVAQAVVEMVGVGSIRLVDTVVLTRRADRAEVTSGPPAEHASLGDLDGASEHSLLLSPHDVELAAVTLEPGEAALLLLVEDRWAGVLSQAARSVGARVAAGERITRDRVLAAVDSAGRAGGRRGGADLLVRTPGVRPLVDQVAQLGALARLVDDGVLPLERYDVQRRRMLDG